MGILKLGLDVQQMRTCGWILQKL